MESWGPKSHSWVLRAYSYNIEIKHSLICLYIPECDITFIPPNEYTPPKAENGGSNGNGVKNGFEDDPYDRIVRGSLKIMEKQRVSPFIMQIESRLCE